MVHKDKSDTGKVLLQLHSHTSALWGARMTVQFCVCTILLGHMIMHNGEFRWSFCSVFFPFGCYTLLEDNPLRVELNLCGRMFLGSVSNYCANHAQCAVMIIKGNGSPSQSR